MITFHVKTENKNHLCKPSAAEVGAIRSRMQLRDRTVKSLENAMRHGRATQPAIIRAKKFVSQQVFIVEVDNADTLCTVKESKQICIKKGICPNIIGRSFSGTQENQKHHLVFVTDKPVRSLEKRNRLQKALTELFAGDTACNDVNHIFFGGNFIHFSQSAWYLTDADIEKLIGGDVA